MYIDLVHHPTDTTIQISRPWFQIFVIFTPEVGEDSHFDEHIFQMGWFNLHLVFCVQIWFTTQPLKYGCLGYQAIDFYSQFFGRQLGRPVLWETPRRTMRTSSAFDGMRFCVRMGGWLTASMADLHTFGGFTYLEPEMTSSLWRSHPPKRRLNFRSKKRVIWVLGI